MLKKFAKSEKGFTLIELLIVVAIIGILAAIAIPQFAQYRQRGYASAVRSDVKNAYTATTVWFGDNPNAAAFVGDTAVGGTPPTPYTTLTSASISPGVTVVVSAAAADAFTVTGTHAQITNAGANYVMQADGTVADNLNL